MSTERFDGIRSLWTRKCFTPEIPKWSATSLSPIPCGVRGENSEIEVQEGRARERDTISGEVRGWGQSIRPGQPPTSPGTLPSATPTQPREEKPAGTRAAFVSWIMIYEIRATRIHLATACLPCSPMQFVGTSPRYSINNIRHAHLSLENNLGPRGCTPHACTASCTDPLNDYELTESECNRLTRLKLDTCSQLMPHDFLLFSSLLR